MVLRRGGDPRSGAAGRRTTTTTSGKPAAVTARLPKLPRKRPAAASARRTPATAAARLPKLPRSLPRRVLRLRGRPVFGVDEAGRGPWAGPFVAAAVAVSRGASGLEWGITDSKLLGEPQRERVYKLLTSSPHVSWNVGVVGHRRIDKINILEAAHEAMASAVQGLQKKTAIGEPGRVLVDGNMVPSQLADLPCEAVVHGDRERFLIAAASIIAKVTRDRLMVRLDRRQPGYGFGSHKGYGTVDHQRALERHGPSPVHRRTFEPIKGFLETGCWAARKGSED